MNKFSKYHYVLISKAIWKCVQKYESCQDVELDTIVGLVEELVQLFKSDNG